MEANIFILLIICLIGEAFSFDSTIDLSGNTTTTINNTNLSQIKQLLIKCNNSTDLSIKEQCDVCSLCQNEAFCRQTKNTRPKLQKHSPIGTIDPLSALRDLVDFSCYCVPGYTGHFCQVDINECLSMPCSNNATCIDRVNSFECVCPDGFKGEFCQDNINECESSPCSNNSTCIDLINGYKCECLAGYMGPKCDVDTNECDSQPCKNNASCLDLINKFECDCSGTGYEGTHCDLNIDECLHAVCEHNSTCIDGINSFHCQCLPGYTGQLCEIDIDECLSSPCIFGQCWQNSNPQTILKRIEHISTTMPTALFTNESSFQNQIDVSLEYSFNYQRAAGYWCQCKPGYTGLNCETKINECESNPCGVNGKCLDLVNEFNCECYSGYKGTNCQENIDECKLMSPCAQQTKCIDLKPDYTSLTPSLGYYCDCSQLNEKLFKENNNKHISWSGSNCTVKLNACETYSQLCQHNSECQSVLVNNQQDIKCECQPGWTGKYCQIMTTLRLDGSYSPRIAVSNGPNIHLSFDFRISFVQQNLLPLVYLEHSSSLLFEIKLHQNYLIISNGQLNISEKIAFYHNPNVWHSIELLKNDETLDLFRIVYSVSSLHLTLNRTVSHSFNSINPNSIHFGKFYQHDSFYLSSACLRDVMLNENHMFLSSTQNKNIKFGCESLPRVNEFNETLADINSTEALSSSSITCQEAAEYACFNNGICESNQDGISCLCPKYYSGRRCEIFDPCLSNNCSNDSICKPNNIINKNSAESQFECLCNDGFIGKYCTIRLIDTCLAKPCENNGICSNITVFNQPNKLTYECKCANGYEGKNCQFQTDFCKVNHPCMNGASCINLNRSNSLAAYQCTCSKGWTGINCTEDIDECKLMKSKPRMVCSGNGRCLNTKGDYTCNCNQFHYGKNCEMTHICKQHPCENEASCLLDGDVNENKYICKCAFGYTGVNCSYPTCDLQLCQHDSLCEMINSTSFECNCSGTGHVGAYCEHLVNNTQCHMLACYNNTCNPNICDCNSINCNLYLAKQIKPNQFMYHLVLWPLVGVMFALLSVLFGVFVVKMQKNKATHGTYSPSRHELQASRIGFNMDFKRPPEERLI